MNYFYDIIPPEIQEIIIREASASLIQHSWYNFINNKMIICKNFINNRVLLNGTIPPINMFDINIVLNIEQASRIITGRSDDADFWLTILYDLYDTLEFHGNTYQQNPFTQFSNKFVNNIDCNLYNRVEISYSKLCQRFSN